MIIRLYRKLIPDEIRAVIYSLFLKRFMQFIRGNKRKNLENKLREEIPLFFENQENKGLYPDAYYQAAQWIKTNGFSMFPADFSKVNDYTTEVFTCKKSNLHYIEHQGKAMYFPKYFSKQDCQSYYQGLLIEQDVNSPHRYFYDCFKDKKNWTVMDIGAAEGIFALSVIDYVDKIYLFECDAQWLDALHLTFEPYKEKVEIINRYVSNENFDNKISLDSFMKDKAYTHCYLKMDIEGAELIALQGAEQLIEKGKLFISVCTYHLDDIGENIKNFMERKGYTCAYTPGVMTFGEEPPYFRKGVLYVTDML